MPPSGRANAGGGEADPVTLGEVARNLEKLAEQMERGFERVDERFNTLAMVHQDVYLADRAADSLRHAATADRIAAVEKDIDAIRGTNQWLFRTVVGAIIVLVVGAVWSLSTIGGVH